MKKKILWYSDFLCPTGFGLVAENIIERLMPYYDIDVLAINYNGLPLKEDSPYYKFKDLKVHMAYDGIDALGRFKLYHLLNDNDYDYLFVVQDAFNLALINNDLRLLKKNKRFKYILYFPIDGDFHKDWLEVLDIPHQCVAYTNWGKNSINRDMPVIYHGVDKEFYELPEQEKLKFKKDYFNIDDDTIIITNVNRNQPRKDLIRTIKAYSILEKDYPKSILYLNCDPEDKAGHNLHKIIDTYFNNIKHKILFPKGKKGYITKEQLRGIYNVSNMLVSTTLGEGWGLSTIEAMACGCPVVIPDNTTANELIGNDRGYLIDCYNTDSLWVANLNDNNQIRPIVDVNNMVRKMEYIIKYPMFAWDRAKKAKQWVKDNCDWDKIVKQWIEVIEGLK